MKFLPDGRLLVVRAGRADPRPAAAVHRRSTRRRSCRSRTSARPASSRASTTSRFDPNFATNRFFYVFYTLGTPNRDRLSRFTANAALHRHRRRQRARPLHGPDQRQRRAPRRGDQLRQRRQALLHHRRALRRRRRPGPRQPPRQDPPDQPRRHRPDRQPVLRRRRAELGQRLGPRPAQPVPGVLRRARPTACSSATSAATTTPRPRRRSTSAPAAPTTAGRTPRATAAHPAPVRSTSGPTTGATPRSPAASSTTARSSRPRTRAATSSPTTPRTGSRRLTFDASGNVTGVSNFEPADGSVDGPYGDIVYMVEGPDGALYYLDLGYSDISGQFGISKIRRIRYVHVEPVADRDRRSATRRPGPTPLSVAFSSAGSADPEGQPITYAWTFGDGGTSTAANPTHTYTQPGQYTVRLTVSDGVNTTNAPADHRQRGRPADGDDQRADRRRRRSSPATSSRSPATPPTPTRARSRRARSPGTSTSCTRATSTRARRSPASRTGRSRSRRAVTTSAATRGTGSR